MASKHFKRWDAEYTYEVANSKIAIDAFEITLEHFMSFMSSTSFSVSSLRFLCGERERDKESERERERAREREREGELQTALSSQKGLSICPLLLWFWVNFWHWALEFYQHHYIA